MSDRGYSLLATGRWLAGSWHDFFHQPQDARPSAAVRIAYSVVILINLAVLYPDLELWFTDAGVLPSLASQEVGETYKWSLLWRLPSTLPVVQVCYWSLVLYTLSLLIGFGSRLSAVGVLVWLISFDSRNGLILDGEDLVMRIIAFYLILMPCGHCWSVDALVRKWWTRRRDRKAPDPHPGPLPEGEGELEPRTPNPDAHFSAPAWGLRLLQIQMAVIFFTAGLWKLGGEPWLNGTAIYYVARMDDYFGRFPDAVLAVRYGVDRGPDDLGGHPGRAGGSGADLVSRNPPDLPRRCRLVSSGERVDDAPVPVSLGDARRLAGLRPALRFRLALACRTKPCFVVFGRSCRRSEASSYDVIRPALAPSLSCSAASSSISTIRWSIRGSIST